MLLSLDPLANILLEFQAIAPTRAVWPWYVKNFWFFTTSQSWTYPECVPTAKVFEETLQEVLVTKSLDPNSTNLTTLEFVAFQRYTELLSPTASTLEADQSTKFK